MKNENDNVFPYKETIQGEPVNLNNDGTTTTYKSNYHGPAHTIEHPGMSKRFYAACAAMQGLVSGYAANPNRILINGEPPTVDNVAQQAFNLADELLKQEEL